MIRIVAACAAVCIASPALAQGRANCASYDSALEQLAEGYHEEPVVTGRGVGAGMQILASPDGKTWTALVIMPDGRACIVMDGTDLRIGPMPIAGEPA